MDESNRQSTDTDNYYNAIDSIINHLVNKFLLTGIVIGLLAILIPLIPLSTREYTAEFYFDIANVSALIFIYLFRNRFSVKFKVGYIIVIVYSFFITNAYNHGLTSLANIILVLLPLLSILVYSIRQTIIIYGFIILSFLATSLNHLTRPLNIENEVFLNESITWILYTMILSMVCLVIALLVHNLSTSFLELIKRYETNNQLLVDQDAVLKQAIVEKNVLLQEIHHRVKNNLAVVSGLLGLQSNIAPDEFTRSTLQLSTNRIISISKVHELLYQSDDVSRIHFKQYIEELAEIIINSFNKTEHEIDLYLDINIPYLNVNHGVPVGIILNELITNSLKHGFNQPQAVYSIHISAFEEKDFFEIFYQDNGSGHQENTDSDKPGLGKTLIDSLLTQIDAEYHLEKVNKYQLSFRFPK